MLQTDAKHGTSRFPPSGLGGGFLFTALLLVLSGMTPCEGQVIVWGRDLDTRLVTLDVGLASFNGDQETLDLGYVPWHGPILEYEFIKKRIALLYGFSATGILSGTLAAGVSNGIEEKELGVEFKAMAGLLIVPIDLSFIRAYSYREHGIVYNVAVSIGLGMLLPIFYQQ
jgi:hypothetical protein